MSNTRSDIAFDPPCSTPAGTWQDYGVLSKWRLNAMVLLTTLVGYLLAAGTVHDLGRMVHAMLGVWFAAIGAGAINQYLERDTDALMDRTRSRPLPSGRLSATQAMRFGTVCLCGGILELLLFVNLLAAFLCVLTAVSYLFVYTPLKRVTVANTLVGAIPGALPPVIGWAAALDDLSTGSWVLFAIMYTWQLPHFFAIAWMYREDYRQGGMQMISGLDDSGARTAQHMVMSALNLVFVSMLPMVIGMTGPIYGVGAALLGATFIGLCVRFSQARSRSRARTVMLGSLIYLPALLGLWLLNS